jgi:hypothetical protein
MKFLMIALTLILSVKLLAADYQYEEQKLSVYDSRNKLISESYNYRFITTDNDLKRISVETTEATIDYQFRNRNLYRIYQGPNKQWVLEDTLNPGIKMALTIRNKDNSEWPIKNYTAVGNWLDKGKQLISFEQTLANSRGRIDFSDWKGYPKGYVLIEGKVIHEAQYLAFLKKVKH